MTSSLQERIYLEKKKEVFNPDQVQDQVQDQEEVRAERVPVEAQHCSELEQHGGGRSMSLMTDDENTH